MKWVYFSQLFYLFSNILAFFLVTKFLVFCVFLAKIRFVEETKLLEKPGAHDPEPPYVLYP